MAGTNDAVNKGPKQIIIELIKLKEHVENILPGCNVTLSCPTKRIDKENPQAQKTVFDLRKHLINMKIPIILNENVVDVHIGEHGLHLNAHGLGRLAVNYITYMRKH